MQNGTASGATKPVLFLYVVIQPPALLVWKFTFSYMVTATSIIAYIQGVSSQR